MLPTLARSRQRLVARVRSWEGSRFECLSTIPLPLCIFPPLARRTPPVTSVILHLSGPPAPAPALAPTWLHPPMLQPPPPTHRTMVVDSVSLCAPPFTLEARGSRFQSRVLDLVFWHWYWALVLALDPRALGLVAVAGCRTSQTASFRRTSSHPYIPMSPHINQRASHHLLRYRPDHPGPCLRFRPSPEGPFPGLHGGPSSWIPH